MEGHTQTKIKNLSSRILVVSAAGHWSLVWVSSSTKMGHTPSTAGTFRKKFRKDSGKSPETLSERFLKFPSRVRLGCPKPYDSRHLRLPERFQNSLPPSTAGDASFFRIGSGEGLSELVMEFPAVLGVFLKKVDFPQGLRLMLSRTRHDLNCARVLYGKVIRTNMTNPGTTPITILAIHSDHGLSFAGEETRTMVSVSFSLNIYSTFEFWRFKFSVV